MAIKSIIAGCGSYLPERIMTNYDLEKMVDTSHDWIVKRSGIEQRHIAAEGELTSDMALKAGLQAIEHAGITAQDLDAIIVATTTPDLTFPSTATQVQAKLGISHGFAFDVQAVCSGFIYGLSTADALIQAGRAKNILLIGAEKMSAILDWADRGTCVLFGDGAGAVVLSAHEADDGRGIMSCHLRSDGNYTEYLRTTSGPASSKDVGLLTMQGKEVFKMAVTCLAEVAQAALDHNNVTAEDLDWLVPHQANIRIIEATAKKLKLPVDKVVRTIHEHGNTSAASIPLALASAVHGGQVKTGDLLLLEAMGAGFTWGSSLLRF